MRRGVASTPQHAEAMLAEEPADAGAVGAKRAYVRYEPLGPVLAVMPWNFPLWQVIRFAAPALMAGNVGLLKHASNVPQTALLIEETFRTAGFPEGAFQTLLIGAASVERILRDPRVRAATLTGSTPAGRSIGRIAGEELKPVVLELGGSDPYVVMPSADIEKAAQTAVTARVQNNGQSCIAAKRFIVHEAVADAFEELFVARMNALRVGDPLDEKTDIGPLANEQGLLDVEEYIGRRGRAGCAGVVRRTARRRSGLLLPADRHHRHHARDADVLRGDLRSGRATLPRARRRRSDRAGERDRVRPRIERLDDRCR